MLVGAAEAMRARRDLEERQPEAKVSNDYPRWAARGGEEGQGLPPAAFRALPALEAEG